MMQHIVFSPGCCCYCTLLYNCWSALELINTADFYRTIWPRKEYRQMLYPPKTNARCSWVLVGFSTALRDPPLFLLCPLAPKYETPIYSQSSWFIWISCIKYLMWTKPLICFESLTCWTCYHNFTKLPSFMLTPCDLCSQCLIIMWLSDVKPMIHWDCSLWWCILSF